MVPKVQVVCPVARQPGLVGDLPHRAVEGGTQRLLERVEVLADADLGAVVVDHAEGRPQVLGHLGLRPTPSRGTCTPVRDRR